jgi:hypothetical protein
MPWKKGQRPKVVLEKEATEPVAGIYWEIKQALGLPMVPYVYQTLAVYPRFLAMHWERMRPLVATREFFDLGGRVRADAYTRAHSYFPVPDLCHQIEELKFTRGAKQELTETVDVFQYKNPLVLLLMATQLQAFDKPVGSGGGSAGPANARVPEMEAPVLVGEDHAPSPIKRIYEDIKRTMNLPFVPADHLALARWPDFFQSYWSVMKPLMESPIYSECQWAVRDTTWQVTAELPITIELTCEQLTDAGIADEDVGICVKIVELFVKTLSGLVLNTSAAKIGLEGGTLTPPLRHDDSPERRAA